VGDFEVAAGAPALEDFHTVLCAYVNKISHIEGGQVSDVCFWVINDPPYQAVNHAQWA
jgi:hypothetical protein